MSSRYFETSEDASAALGLPLLIASSAAAAVPRTAGRLSAMAIPAVVGARLFHRARRPGAPNGQALWIASPCGTLEYLSWAVGLAEHEAGAARTAFLCDPDPGSPLARLAAGAGSAVPHGVARLAERLGIGAAAVWPTDLQGVRLVRAPGTPTGPTVPDPARWTLILGRSVPEEDADLAMLGATVDLTIYVASIRDHTIDELATELHRLRAAGLDPIGLVTMGPPLKREPSPVERWEIAKPAASEPAAPEPVAPEPAAPERAVPRPSPAPAVPEAPALGVGTEAVPLVAAWKEKRRRNPLVWIVPAAVMVLAAGVALLRSGLPGAAGVKEPRSAAVESVRETPPPPVPASPPDTGDTPVPAPSSIETAESTESAPELAAGAWPDSFVIHLSSWQHRSHAENEISRVRELGYPAHVVRVEIPGKGRWYRVVLGAFPDSFSACIVADALREEGRVGFAQVIGSGGRGAPGRPAPR